MTAQSAESYINHPTFNSAMKHFQEGDWTASLKEVDWLLKQFPLERELQRLQKDISTRAKLDLTERSDDRIEKRKKLFNFALRSGLLLAVLFIGLLTFSSFSGVIQEKIQLARNAIDAEVEEIELAAMYRDAQALLQADRPDEAYTILLEIVDRGGDFPDLQETLVQATDVSNIKTRYEEAVRLYDLQDWSAAQALLEDISRVSPNYRNVASLIANIQGMSALTNMYDQSTAYFEAGEWEQAVSGYESLRSIDPTYRTDTVIEQLFHSYVNAARTVLVDQEDSLEALRTAENYFRKALALHPQDPEIKAERELARLYIDAQAQFLAGQWTEVISGLEVVYAKEPSYAVGAALQTLYEAYVARGDNRLAAGEYELALSDFQRAVVLAEQDPEAVLRLYEAQLKVAEAQGVQDNYEAAVLLYRSAVELTRLKDRAKQEDLAQLALLEEAEYYATIGNFSVSYERYRAALGIVPGNYCLSFDPYQEALHYERYMQTMTRHTVEPGEYLTLIANRYHSTVCAIVLANEITDPDTIYQGQELIIPVF
jgi:tetratricopeptide (TPR) repeat protein